MQRPIREGGVCKVKVKQVKQSKKEYESKTVVLGKMIKKCFMIQVLLLRIVPTLSNFPQYSFTYSFHCQNHMHVKPVIDNRYILVE